MTRTVHSRLVGSISTGAIGGARNVCLTNEGDMETIIDRKEGLTVGELYIILGHAIQDGYANLPVLAGNDIGEVGPIVNIFPQGNPVESIFVGSENFIA